MRGHKDWSENLKNNNENTTSQTESVEELSAMAINNTFLMAEKKFYQEIWDVICKHSSEVKLLSQIPELQDITVEKIKKGATVFDIEIYTNFGGDLYKLLLDNGFPDHMSTKRWWTSNKTIQRQPEGQVHVCIYKPNLSLRILIKKEELS